MRMFGCFGNGLVNDEVNVTVEWGDIVIDTGAWIGDFAAYVLVKGASVCAFEPSARNFGYLVKTAELNGNIIPVMKGLSHKTEATKFSAVSTGDSASDRFDTSAETLTDTDDPPKSWPASSNRQTPNTTSSRNA